MNIKICLLICTSVLLVQRCTGRDDGDEDDEHSGKRKSKRKWADEEESDAMKRNIIGGRKSVKGERTYYVALSTSRHGKFCGGTIISPRYILTAAHCFNSRKKGDELYVIVGALNEQHPGVSYKSSKIIIHENYISKRKINDIALVQLEKPISFKQDARAIKLPDSNTKVNDGDIVTLAGFGKTDNDRPSKHLLEADLEVINLESCKKKYSKAHVNYVTDNNICIKFKEKDYVRSDSCQGDSGGGAILNDTIISIVSFSVKGLIACKGMDFPSVHTRVTKYLDWIKENTK